MPENKQCFIKCPSCQKSIKTICTYVGKELLGYVKINCGYCNFKSKDFTPANPIMNEINYTLIDYVSRKPKIENKKTL